MFRRIGEYISLDLLCSVDHTNTRGVDRWVFFLFLLAALVTVCPSNPWPSWHLLVRPSPCRRPVGCDATLRFTYHVLSSPLLKIVYWQKLLRSVVRHKPLSFVSANSLKILCAELASWRPPSKHAGSDLAMFGYKQLWPSWPKSGQTVYAWSDFPHPVWFCFSKEGMDHVVQNWSRSIWMAWSGFG